MSNITNLSSDEEQFDEDEWQEMETTSSSVTCLFCSHVLPCLDNAIDHCDKHHNFNLERLKSKFNMDCYSYIKLINYIKTTRPTVEVINNADKPLWDDDKYLKPVDTDEWLMFDFESALENKSPQTFHANVENGLVTLSQTHFTELQRTIQDLSRQLKEKQDLLELARQDMEIMKKSMHNIVNSGISDEDVKVNCVSKVPLECDEGYFESYSHFGIHYEMLSDRIRTESYRSAILDNAALFRDKKVLDLGCGTGILSMFSAKAGAKKVYAIDQSEIVFQAMDIIRENYLNDTITVLKGRLENTKLEEKVDIIVSEWMGYFLLFEGMLDSVIYARNNFLKPGGVLLPNRCTISLVASGDIDVHNKLVDYWSDVYGFKMNCMKNEVIKQATIDIVRPDFIISEPCLIKSIDINTCENDVSDFVADFCLPIIKDGKITSFVGYFDTFFDLPCKVGFSTSPQSEPTHWKQTVFYLKNCIDVKSGDNINGKITCSRLKSDARGLSAKIELFGKVLEYLIN